MAEFLMKLVYLGVKELVDQAGPKGHDHHLGAVAGAELASNASQVALHGQG
jgi:hypothetical protein